MALSKLIQMIRDRWAWNMQFYPDIPADEQGVIAEASARRRFQRKHILLHMMKQIAALSEIEQACDHEPHDGSAVRTVLRRRHIAKMLVNTLQFIIVEGFTEKKIIAEIRRFYPLRKATFDEMREILKRPEELHRLLGFEPVSSSLPGDGAGVRIVVCIKADSKSVTPKEIEFDTKNGRVRATIEVRRTNEEFVPYQDPSI